MSLNVIEPPTTEPCCGACAAAATRPVSTEQPTLIPVERDSRPSVARAIDRRITVAGIGIAAGFVAAAVASTAVPAPARHGLWLPVHLALAGGAGTAVASVLPFFVTTLAVVAPARPLVRAAAIVLVALGAIGASVGIAGGLVSLALAGVVAYVAGLIAVATAAFVPLRGRPLAQRRSVIIAYGAAIACVVVGIAIVGAMLAGIGPVGERWGVLKPAHAWLNVFGFLSVVVAATLVHLAPTVAGTRIVPRRTASTALLLLVAGPPVVAAGFALGDGIVARIGTIIEVLGAAALALHAVAVWRDRGRWTTDPAWHRMTSWSLSLAPMWFLVAVILASGRIVWFGADASAWRLEDIAAPLAIGWLIQAMVGSWSQLVPAIGPGGPEAHARQRIDLARGATSRVVALNTGVLLLVVGTVLDAMPMAVGGMVASAGAIIASILCLVAAMHSAPSGRVARSLSVSRGG